MHARSRHDPWGVMRMVVVARLAHWIEQPSGVATRPQQAHDLRTFSLVNKFTMRQELAWRSIHFWRLQEMRFNGIALLASAVVLGACGGENKAPDTAAANA